MKVTREQAWKMAVDDALRHHVESSRRDTATSEQNLTALYTGLRVLRDKMTRDELRTTDLTQLIACALDCLGSALYDASQRGEDLSKRLEAKARN